VSRSLRKTDDEVQQLISGWDWDRVFFIWASNLSRFGCGISPLFHSISVHDPSHPQGRPAMLAWWKKDEIQAETIGLQRHLDFYPGTRALAHPSRRGEQDTVEFLWQYKDEPEVVAAILIAGSLFARLQSNRARYPVEDWPSFRAVSFLEKLAYARWGRAQGWHYACTDVIPIYTDDSAYRIDDLYGLVRYLAEEHAALLSTFTPIVVNFVSDRDPFIAKTLNVEYEAERKRHEEWNVTRRATDVRRAQEVVQLREKHPRWGEWRDISKVELEKLTWTMPTVEIALQFGVSDVAVGKRCRSLGIKKPPPGFWAKVRAGKLPHPNGSPSL
jgi:hypothetical protein